MPKKLDKSTFNSVLELVESTDFLYCKSKDQAYSGMVFDGYNLVSDSSTFHHVAGQSPTDFAPGIIAKKITDIAASSFPEIEIHSFFD